MKPDSPRLEPFELSMLGGPIERRYRRLRPEVERLPWGTLRPDRLPEAKVLAARRAWTEAAFQEHRTGAACAATLEALIRARAPLDLIGMASRFPLDEMVHVELCARLATELGGGSPIEHDPAALIVPPTEGQRPLAQAAELVVRNFCVGEAVSIPLLRGTWHAATHPLVKGVLGRIVRDEAAHGTFGWVFLDWALDQLDGNERALLCDAAGRTIAAIRDNWRRIAHDEVDAAAGAELGWMGGAAYQDFAARSMEREVIAPLRARGLEPR